MQSYIKRNKEWQTRGMCLTIFLMMFCVTFAQQQKKTYTSELDSLWSREIYINKLTTDGNWVVFTELFGHKNDVMYLKHTSDSITFKFPKSQWIAFSDNNHWFGCIAPNNELSIIDLINKSKATYQGIESHKFSKSGNYIAALQEDIKSSGTLLIMDLKTKAYTSIEGVATYSWHPLTDILLLTLKEEQLNKVVLYKVGDKKPKVLKENKGSNYSHVLWSGSGNAMVFMEQIGGKNFLHYYQMDGGIISLNNSIMSGMETGFQLADKAPYISENGERVLFYRQKIRGDSLNKKHPIEIWNANDPWIYPRMQRYGKRDGNLILTAWYPKALKIKTVETEKLPSAAMYVNHNYALTYNKFIYAPQYTEYPNVDIFIKNIRSGIEKLVVNKQSTYPGSVNISPTGKYISYYKDKDWWVYKVDSGQTVNVTKALKVSFANFAKYPGNSRSFGNPGWAVNDQYIILYDQFDIWIMTPDGSMRKRITEGREENVRYRIDRRYNQDNLDHIMVNRNFSSISFDLHHGIILEKYDMEKYETGYAFWRKGNRNPKTFVWDNYKIDGLLTSKNLNKIVYRKQKTNEPIGVYSLNLKTSEQHLLYQSNEQLLNYDLGKTQIIKYTLDTGEVLNGILVYPANFNPNKKYPMIVHIYEKIAHSAINFKPPSDLGFQGFNILKYTTNGYFVFYPNITYNRSNPGISALKCVTVAVDRALKIRNIDKNKIGLLGHSFGGYEAAFIATQTDKFAAIVAGAAVTNMISHYHSVGWNWDQPEMWRYENQQWRMGEGYYQNKGSYMRNSPMQYVENVKTPLLLWTGKEDFQINWTQSLEMFLALRRLNKTAKLLLIEEEGHVPWKNDNQKKLSQVIRNWFDTYCKK